MAKSSSQILLKKLVGGFMALVFVAGLIPLNVKTASAAGLVHRTYTITPTSATVAVGSSVQFRVNEYYDGVFTKEVTLEDTSPYSDNFYADPFYLKKGDLPGSFVGVNPGSVKVIYQNNSVTVSAQVTVTGTAAPTSGKIKITSSKDIYDQMFPRAADCDPGFGYHCTNGIMDNYKTFKVDTSFDPPAFLTGWIRWQNHFPAKGDNSGPMFFSLEDPMNPVLYPGFTQTNNVDTDNDWEGDFGPYLSTQDLVASKDGSYQFITDSYRRLDGWHNGQKRHFGLGGGVQGNLVGVIDRGYRTFLITDWITYDVTDFETLDTEYGRPKLPSLPTGFPRMTAGRKFILSDENYVASIEGTALTAGYRDPLVPPRLRIYDLGKSSPIASLSLSADVANGVPTWAFRQKRDANTDYIVMLVGPQWAAGQPYSNVYSPQSIYVYKFNTQTKQLTKAISGLKLNEGRVVGATGFNLGDQRGIIALTSVGKNYQVYGAGPLSFPTSNEYRARAYLYTDLADGKVEDVLANSPVTSVLKLIGGPMTSVVSGNSTYVYIAHGSVGPEDGPTYVWKLDLAGVTPPPPPPPPSGGGGAGGGGGGAGGGGGVVSGSCDFTLTATPQSRTVKQGTYFAIYNLSSSQNTDPTCTVSVTAPVLKDSSGNRIIYTSSADAILVAPGGQSSAVFNVSAAPVGSYTIDLKATARGISAKTISLGLTVN